MDDIFLHVCKYLTTYEYLNLRLVSQKYNDMVQNKKLFEPKKIKLHQCFKIIHENIPRLDNIVYYVNVNDRTLDLDYYYDNSDKKEINDDVLLKLAKDINIYGLNLYGHGSINGSCLIKLLNLTHIVLCYNNCVSGHFISQPHNIVIICII